MSQAKLFFESTEDEVELPEGSSIAQACEEQGLPFGCTEGICGTCLMEADESEGQLSPLTPAEEEFVGKGPSKERLACQCSIVRGRVVIKF